MPRVLRRRPTHAGSWYTDDGAELERQLSGWLAAVPPLSAEQRIGRVRCVIAPHAGYSYSGPCAAHAYAHLREEALRGDVKRVFLLGPSHHYYLAGCALSQAQFYRTPVGDLEVCAETYAELRATGEFDEMHMADDEAEHSMEMHAPYIAHVFSGVAGVRLVPILVGALSFESEERYGRLLSPYLGDPGTVFVISSDFCHWGRRFRYTPFHSTSTAERPLFKCIEQLDRCAGRRAAPRGAGRRRTPRAAHRASAARADAAGTGWTSSRASTPRASAGTSARRATRCAAGTPSPCASSCSRPSTRPRAAPARATACSSRATSRAARRGR